MQIEAAVPTSPEALLRELLTAVAAGTAPPPSVLAVAAKLVHERDVAMRPGCTTAFFGTPRSPEAAPMVDTAAFAPDDTPFKKPKRRGPQQGPEIIREEIYCGSIIYRKLRHFSTNSGGHDVVPWRW